MSIAEGNTEGLGQALAERGEQPPQVGKTLQQEVRDLTPALQAALPPGIITPDRFVRTVLTTIRKNEELLNCTRESFLGSMLTAAQLGLEVDPALGQAYLVPYRDRNRGTVDCTLQIGYKGYIELAWRGGITMKSTDVREHDVFSFERGTKAHLSHSWKLGQERGDIIGYYALATFPDGRVEFEIMDLADIEARKKRSQVRSDRGPWKSDPVAMSKKTVIRAMVPQIPLTTELSRALEVDEGIVKMQGAGRDLVTSFPDPADQEVGGGSSALPPGGQRELSDWRREAEEGLDLLMDEAEDRDAAVAWLMREHGPIPTLDDERLLLATTQMEAWLDDGHRGAQAPVEATAVASPSPAAPEAPPATEAASGDSGPTPEERIYGSTVATVTSMKAEKVRETLGLFLREGETIPKAVGEQRTLLIAVLARERLAGNPAAEAIF